MFEFEREFYLLLKEFHKVGALNDLILIGSWCLMIYRDNYPITRFAFNTSDIDFSIYRPQDLQNRARISIHELLTKLGYVAKISIIDNAEKYVPAPFSTTNNLNIEFLCEPGRHIKEPYRIPQLGITTTPLQFQKILFENSEKLTYKEIPVKVPIPSVWAIHKIAISQRRTGKDSELKMVKDLQGALIIVEWLGKKHILQESEKFSGKFLNLFRKGFRILQSKYDI